MIFRSAIPTGALALAIVLPICGARAQAVASDTHALGGAATGLAPTGLAPIGVLEPISSLAGEAQNSDAMNPAAAVVSPSQPSDLPKPFATFSASARSLGDSLVALARAQLGRRYRFGGTSPEHGFDCSGLVRYVLAALHVDIPRTAREQARVGTTVPRDPAQLRPGDLVTFGSGAQHISHIGIYVGNGRFVQASSRAGRVIETPLNRRLIHGAEPWRGAQRVMPADAPPVAPAVAVPQAVMTSTGVNPVDGLEY